MTVRKSSNKKPVVPRAEKVLSEDRTQKAEKGNPEKALTVHFLLAEYNGLLEFWKHTDARIERGINIYITICTLIFPGLGLLYQAIQTFQLFILISIGVATATFTLGFLLVQRIMGAQSSKSKYKLGMQVIRRYFVDHDPEIARYLYMRVGPHLENPYEVKELTSAYSHKNLVRAINGFNSLLAGGILGSITWLSFGNFLAITTLVLLCLGFSILTFLILNWLFWRRIKRRASNLSPGII